MGFIESLKNMIKGDPKAKSFRDIKDMDRIHYNEARPEQLMQAIRHSFNYMESFRKIHTKLVREYVGDLYGECGGYSENMAGRKGNRAKVVIPKINQMVQIYDHLLASATPRTIISTKYKDLRPMGYKLQVALNKLIQEVFKAFEIKNWRIINKNAVSDL